MKQPVYQIIAACLVLFLFFKITKCSREKYIEPKQSLNIQYVIDSAQNVIRDSIKKINKSQAYWSSYETGLPKGKVIKLHAYSYEDYKLDGKESTEDEYGVILIETETGEYVHEIVTHDQYIVIDPGDIIK